MKIGVTIPLVRDTTRLIEIIKVSQKPTSPAKLNLMAIEKFEDIIGWQKAQDYTLISIPFLAI